MGLDFGVVNIVVEVVGFRIRGGGREEDVEGCLPGLRGDVLVDWSLYWFDELY